MDFLKVHFKQIFINLSFKGVSVFKKYELGYSYCSWPGCWSNSEKCTWVESNSKIKTRWYL